jgi:hypothetical protein
MMCSVATDWCAVQRCLVALEVGNFAAADVVQRWNIDGGSGLAVVGAVVVVGVVASCHRMRWWFVGTMWRSGQCRYARACHLPR